ncbi:MAG: amylo-alpha-1,6-glucosidase [Bacteroidales bacterium]|jgi:predicted glycogen debranching enzyme
MSYINFDKNQLVNLEYSLNRELLRSNRAGSYACTTILGCNTRKYHGLLVAPQPTIDGENHVLLSSLDITVIQREAEFNFGIHKYPGGVYYPKGHKYFSDFTTEPIPKLTFRVGGVILAMELLLALDDERLLVRYTLEDAHSPTVLRIKPFLAFRNIHKLCRANVFVERKYEAIENGIKYRMYAGYSNLFMQFSKKVEYTHAPDWNYNVEYTQEQLRGYDYQEDLFVPGFFEVPLKKGEAIVLSVGTSEKNPTTLKKLFTTEIKHRIPRDSFVNNLINSAHQFIVRRDKKTEVMAGFPWFGRWGRDTFIALPGITLAIDDPKTCKAVLDTMVSELHGPLFPNVGHGNQAVYNSADAPLWFFWALQQYAEYTGTKETIWKEYGRKLILILEGFRDGTMFNIKMQENGLIYAGELGKAVTWMDAVVAGKPVTPRIGMTVELNALWYNAIMFALEVAKLANVKSFTDEWQPVADNFPNVFKDTFWNKEKGYLADYVCGSYKDWTVRPNMVFATSLPYSPLSDKIRQLVLERVQQELLTPRGLRTLTPKHPDYKGSYSGDQKERDIAYHQGTVWPWLLGHFAEGYLKVHGKSGLSLIKSLYDGFDSAMKEYCVGTIAEIYEGDPPHKAVGALSQAWSVGEILRMRKMIEKVENSD